MEKILLAKEIGEWLNIDVQRVCVITRRGLLPHIKIGERQYRYSEKAIQQWLDQGGNQEVAKKEVQ